MPLGFYLHEQIFVGNADVKRRLHQSVFLYASWVSSLEQGCKTQDLPRALGLPWMQLGAAGRSPGQDQDRSFRAISSGCAASTKPGWRFVLTLPGQNHYQSGRHQ